MIAPVLVFMIALGVPLFAVIALGALVTFRGAELEPGLFIIGFIELGDHPQLLAIVVFHVIAALLGREYLHRWGRLLSSLVNALPAGISLAWLMLASVSVLVVTCGLAMAMAVPAMLYTVSSSVVAPRQTIGADQLLIAALIPAALAATTMACLPGVRRRLQRIHDTVQRPVQPAGPLLWDLPMLALSLAAIVSGWLTLMETVLIALVWVLVTRPVAWRELTWKALPDSISGAVVSSAAMLLMLGLAMSWAAILHDTGVLKALSNGFGPPFVSLAVLAVLLVTGGLVLGVQAGLVMLAPLTIPLGLALGMAPLHLGVVSTACLLLGRGLLPVAQAQMRNESMSAATRVLLVPAVLVVLILVSVPTLSLWLPSAI